MRIALRGPSLRLRDAALHCPLLLSGARSPLVADGWLREERGWSRCRARSRAEGGEINGGTVLPAYGAHIKKASAALSASEIIALPTDTVYGVAACAMSGLRSHTRSESGVQRLYQVKRRDGNRPLAICVADVEDVHRFAATGHLPPQLLADLLPGQVTVLLPRSDASNLPKSFNPGLPTIGVRVPGSDFVREVARAHGAIALTSANISGEPSASRVIDFQDLWSECTYVFDGGHIAGAGAGSTVVDLSREGEFWIVRRGAALEALTAVLEGKYGYIRKG